MNPYGRPKTHGMSRTRIYNVWCHMHSRCSNLKDANYADYGGRGIKVCRRWKRFENFFADMGSIPPGKLLDRKNNDGPYSPGNCRWATTFEQARNTRRNRLISFRGERLTLGEWATRVGLRRETIAKRIRLGWPVSRALTAPLKPPGRR